LERAFPQRWGGQDRNQARWPLDTPEVTEEPAESAAGEPGADWTRRPGESTQAYQAFRRYRDLGASRSVAKVAQELAKSRSLVVRWCTKFDWVERCRLFDQDQERREREERKGRQRHMAARMDAVQATASTLLLQALTVPALEVIERYNDPERRREFSDIPLENLLRVVAKVAPALHIVAQIQRTSLGPSVPAEDAIP
jgi:hypothetical protein